MTYLVAAILIVLAIVVLLFLYTRKLASDAVRAVPQAGQVQPVNGGTIHYVEMGPQDAPTIILIHGLAGQLQHYTYAMTDLLKDDFHVIVIDRPGSGYSERAQDDLAALPEQARMVADFMNAKKLEKSVVVGHSLGGALTLALALDYPDKVSSMALIAPLTQVQEDVPDIFKGLELRSPLMRRIVANTIAAPMGKATADKVLTFAFAPEKPVSDFMIRAAAILGLRPVAFVGASSDMVMLQDAMPVQAARYGELKVPGGVLYGDGDTILNHEKHGKPMTAFGLTYEEMAGRGHMLPMTAPQECVDFVRRMAALPSN